MNIDWIDFLITPLVAAIVGFAVYYFQSRIDALRRAQERLHDDRRNVYAEVLDPFIRVFASLKNPHETEKALKIIKSYEYKKTAFEFSLIGSDKVVRAFNSFSQYTYQLDAEAGEKPDTKTLMLLWGGFLLEIRRNVGDPKTRLSPFDMLRVQIKDIDTIA